MNLPHKTFGSGRNLLRNTSRLGSNLLRNVFGLVNLFVFFWVFLIFQIDQKDRLNNKQKDQRVPF